MEEDYPQLQVSKIVDEVKSQGLFDQLRRDCLSDVENEPAYHRLKNQVDRFCATFLSKQRWWPGVNKMQIRDDLRKALMRADFVNTGVKNLVERLLTDTKVRNDLYPSVERIVYHQLGLPHPMDSQPNRNSPETNSNSFGGETAADSKIQAAAVRRSGSSEEFKNDSIDERPSKRPRLDKTNGAPSETETGPPSQLPSESENTSTYETPVQDELCPPPVDPMPSHEVAPPEELNTSEELSVHWHVTQLSPNPDTGDYQAETEYASARERVMPHIIGPDEVESPAHERL